MAQLEILDDIERLADGYAVTNVLSNIAFQALSLYGVDHALTYILRAIACC